MSGTGTRTAIPTMRPVSSGSTLSMAFAAPVLVGVMLSVAARARLRSRWVPSNRAWSRVKAWMGGHQAADDAEGPVQDLQERSEAVRRAGGRGHDAVTAGVVLLVVDAEDDGDVLVPGRRRDQDPGGAGSEVLRRRIPLREVAGRLDDHVDAVGVPGAQQRIPLVGDPDGPALDDQVG